MKLSSIVYPDINVARSVNLERDKKDINVIEGYQVTTKTIDILGRFANALQGEKVNAWSLTGPYGMGKSAFTNYLMAITGPFNDELTKAAWDKLKAAEPGLHERLLNSISQTAGQEGALQVPVTAAYEPVNNSLARGLHNSLMAAKLPKSSQIINQLQKLMEQKTINSQKLITVFRDTQRIINKPIIIIVDEFGKNLDYMSHHHDKGDIFIMQQLAEMGSVYLWVCLHQAFDEYASGLSLAQRREWSKVQGRFEDISFVESSAQMIYIIKKTLKQNAAGKHQERIKDWANVVYHFVSGSTLAGYKEFDEETIANIYPLHPVTAIALVELCRRYAQNDRTLLSFMCSGDKYALPTYLEKTEVSDIGWLPAVGLEQLYEYFLSTSTTAFINRAESQRWVEVHSIIEEGRNLESLDQKILKTTGVLNILSGTLGLKASKKNISSVIESSSGIDSQVIEKAIYKLIDKGVLHYREYAEEYRLWEGSDFDVNGAIRTAKAELAIGSLDAILEKYLPLSPMIASRHAYQTGTVRRFERRWLNVESLNTGLKPNRGFDGLIIYCFGTIPEIDFVPEVCVDGRPVLLAYGPFEITLKELALEVAAAHLVLEGSLELAHDGVARKEVKYRIKVAEQQFRESLARLYAPGSDNLVWCAKGKQIKITNSKQLSTELSNLCDSCYSSCPRIGNEMINYNNLSSAAARARRELVEAMATDAAEKQLGLTGYGPEVAVYKSLLHAEGLHIKSRETSCWRFLLEGKDSKLKALWDQIDDCVDNGGNEGVTIEHIISILQEPPFGMRMGPAPIYICLYLLVKSNEIAVFREGSYRPYITAAEIALMVKRPDLFTLKRFISTNVEREVFDVYKSILNRAQIKENPGLRNTDMLGVVGPLIKFIDGLPKYAKNTRKISLRAQRVRVAIQNSVEPMHLLFEELPEAVGIHLETELTSGSEWHEKLQKELRETLLELDSAYLGLCTQIEETVLKTFECTNLVELYKTQQKRTLVLINICDDTELKPVIKAFAKEYQEPAKWLRGITGIITKKNIKSWNDEDFNIFAIKLRDYANRISQLEALASENGSLVRENTRLFSIMLPNGKIKREAIKIPDNNDIEVQNKVNEILKLPVDKAKSILINLAEKIFEEDANDSNY